MFLEAADDNNGQRQEVEDTVNRLQKRLNLPKGRRKL